MIAATSLLSFFRDFDLGLACVGLLSTSDRTGS